MQEDNEERFAIKHENRIRKATGLRPRPSYRDDLADGSRGIIGKSKLSSKIKHNKR
ncbi:MAG: hypothetical protein LBM19_02560 [Holosporales bacterium]|jgi:hypothetical protein|nr:hypothetical protein [Holosporales bacterium]